MTQHDSENWYATIKSVFAIAGLEEQSAAKSLMSFDSEC